MKYSFTPVEGNILVIESDNLLSGYDNNHLLREVESKIEAGSNRFIINLAGIKYMNSLGLSFMIAVLTKSRSAGGETVICNVNSKIDQLLAIMKLKSIFSVRDDIESAIQVFNQEEQLVLSD
jgi:anti-sigma B factor antagonist